MNLEVNLHLSEISVFVYTVLIFLAFIIIAVYFSRLDFTIKDIEDVDMKKYDDYWRYLKECKFDRFEIAEKARLAFNARVSDDEKIEGCATFKEYLQKLDAQEMVYCNEYIKKNKKNIYAIERRAELYYEMEKYEESIIEYKYLIKKQRFNPLYPLYCAKAYVHLNKLNDALAVINAYYGFNSNDASYYAALGEVFDIGQEYDLAIKNYTEAIKLKPYSAFNYLYRAEVYKKIGDALIIN